MYFDVLPFDVLQGLSHWIKVVGFIVVLVFDRDDGRRASPPWGRAASWRVLRQLFEGVRDVSDFDLSWRRIWALSTLTIREAIRRKALLGLRDLRRAVHVRLLVPDERR